MPRTGSALAKLMGWAASIFYEIERIGDPIPDGPVLVVANHPNSVADAVVLFHAAGRLTRPLARAPLFDQMIVGTLLRALGGLPVYRREDDAPRMDQNERTFEQAVAALRAGDAVQIYPEGISHSRHGLAPLRTGAARIALRAESETGWSLGLRVVPVGLTYQRKAFFRGRVVVAVGRSFGVVAHRDGYMADPVGAAKALTAEIGRRIERLTLSVSRDEDAALIDAAERLYAREKRWASWLDRQGLGERLPRMQIFARGLAWMRIHEPDRLRRLQRAVHWYHRRLELLGAADVDVPPRYRPLDVGRYVLREGLMLGAMLPFALVGVLVWGVPVLLPRIALRFMPVAYEAVASVKLGVALLVLPAFYAGWVFAAWWWAGALPAKLVAVALPMAGLAAIAWRDRWTRVRDDVRLFLRVVARRRHRDRLAAHRAELVAEFDAALELLRKRGGPSPDPDRDPA